MTSIFYIIVTKDEFQHLLKYDYVPLTNEDEADERMNNWMFLQMKKKLPSHLFETKEKRTDKVIGPHWLFINKEDICWEHMDEENTVLEVVKNVKDCLFFDDNDWVQVANNVMNNFCDSYCAHSQEEADAKVNATPEEIKESWERIFTTDPNIVDVKRDVDYCGEISFRAITPFVYKKNVKRIIMPQ
jgi:hypothetical protein